jgi:hypothetical protein
MNHYFFNRARVVGGDRKKRRSERHLPGQLTPDEAKGIFIWISMGPPKCGDVVQVEWGPLS